MPWALWGQSLMRDYTHILLYRFSPSDSLLQAGIHSPSTPLAWPCCIHRSKGATEVREVREE